MQLRTSIALNYASQLYVTLLAVALVPVLERRMGAEAYGLVAFFSMLFAAFYVLDLGLTPMVQREFARMRAQVLSPLDFRRIWRAFAMVFAGLATAGALAVVLLADALVQRWLNVLELPRETASHAVALMGLAVALRWWSGFHRGAVSGGEHMVWLPVFNALMATLRFPGALLCMHLWGYDVTTFFVFQLGVALLEWAWLAAKAHTLLPQVEERLGWSLAPLRPMWRLGLAGAVAAASGALLMQVDRALLSGRLPLGDFGHFSMAVLVATMVMVLSAPISTVLMPRLARLHAEGHDEDFVQIYRMGSRLASALAMGGALTLAFCAKPLLTAWTGEADWAMQYWPVLAFYALGYGFWAMGGFVYYLQYAHGELKWHAWGNAITLVVWSLMVWWLSEWGGVLAVGMGWAVLTGAYLLLWAWVVHARYMPRVHWAWLWRDVLAMNWPVLLGMLLFSLLGWEPQSRRETFAYVWLVGGVLMALNMAWWAWTERRHWGRWLQRAK